MSPSRARSRAENTALVANAPGPSQLRALRRTIVAYDTAAEYAQEISTLWEEAAESFLTIGRWLNKARETLLHGEWQRLVEEQLPFDRNRAYQLRAVATMVDAGRVLETELPSSSATAYEFASLDRDVLELAKREGVLRPNVKRQEVKAWKRRMLALGASQTESDTLAVRRKALLQRIAQLEAGLAEAHAELAEISGKAG
jgi:hypothetical protein